MWSLIDPADDSSSWWFYLPMLGTGIGAAITGIVLLGIGGFFGADWERRKIDKYSAAEGTSQDREDDPAAMGCLDPSTMSRRESGGRARRWSRRGGHLGRATRVQS